MNIDFEFLEKQRAVLADVIHDNRHNPTIHEALEGLYNLTSEIADQRGKQVDSVDEAKAVLESSGYIGIFWQHEDIKYRAQDRNIELTDEQAATIADYIKYNHDANGGINWDFIDFATNQCFPNETITRTARNAGI